MEDFARSRLKHTLHHTGSFIAQNIRPRIEQVHNYSESNCNGHLRNTPSRRPEKGKELTLRSLSQTRELPPLKKNPQSSEQTRLNIAQVQTIAHRISAKIEPSQLLRRHSIAKERGITIPDNASKIPDKKPRLSAKRRYKLAALILFCGSLIAISQNELIEMARDFFLVLEEGNIFTKMWCDPPIGINVCFSLFSLKNGKAFYNGAKPNLKNLGPFCYKTYRKREIIEWKEKTVSFYESYRMEFNPEQSASLDDEITMINLPLYGSILVAREILSRIYLKFTGPLVYNILNIGLQTTGERPIERYPVGELMHGRKMNVIAIADMFLKAFRKMGIPIPRELGYGGSKLNLDVIANQTYGIVSIINHTTLGPFEAYRRSEDGRQVGDIVSFDGSKTYRGLKAPCNRLQSTDGMFFKRPVTQKQLIIFFYIACRLIKLVKVGEYYHYGALLTRYALDKDMLTMKDPNNHCFCRKDMSLSACEGLSDLSNCLLSAPAEISEANFLHYPNLRRQFNGLDPDLEKYESYVDIDPYLGSPVNAKVYVQGNLHMTPIRSVSVLANIRELPLPIFHAMVEDGMEYRKWTIPAIVLVSNYLRYATILWFLFSVLISGLFVYWTRK